MSIRLKLVIAIIIGVALANSCFDSMAISRKACLNELIAEADYVILGFIREWNPIFKQERDQSGKIIPTVELEGSIHFISVKEVLFARELSWKKEKEVYIFQKGISFESAILFPNRSYLLLLKKDSMDAKFVKKYDLPKGLFFTVLEGRQGQIDSSDLTLFEAVRKFCSIRKLKDENLKIKKWKKLLKSNNVILRKSAITELKKAGFKIEELDNNEQRKKSKEKNKPRKSKK